MTSPTNHRKGEDRCPSLSLLTLFLVIFADLIPYSAGCFASGLARRLALTAAAFFDGSLQILGADGLNMAHDRIPSFVIDQNLSFAL